MSSSNNTPIRVADLSDAVYVPRVPSSSATKAYAIATKPRPSQALDDNHNQYVWNRVAAEPTVAAGPTVAVESGVCPSRLGPNVIEDRFFFEPEPNLKQGSSDLETAEPSRQSVTSLEPLATSKVWGIHFHAVDMEQTLDRLEQIIETRRPSYAVTANLNYAMLCAKNPRLAAFTDEAALVLCDGMPILWRSKLNGTKLPERVAGADLIHRLTERCAKRKLRVYFYGASEGVAEKTANALKQRYPKLIVAGVQCPPFRECSSEEIQSQIARIKQAKPDLLYVALGQPKGEYWIEDHLEELQVPLTIQLGASFDFVAGNATRAPKFMQKLGLEWFHRMFKDPTRLAPRYLQNIVFLLQAVRRELIDRLA